MQTLDDLVTGLVDAVLSMKSDAAANVLNGLAVHDPEMVNRVGRMVARVDESFAARVFDRLAALQKVGA